MYVLFIQCTSVVTTIIWKATKRSKLRKVRYSKFLFWWCFNEIQQLASLHQTCWGYRMLTIASLPTSMMGPGYIYSSSELCHTSGWVSISEMMNFSLCCNYDREIQALTVIYSDSFQFCWGQTLPPISALHYPEARTPFVIWGCGLRR